MLTEPARTRTRKPRRISRPICALAWIFGILLTLYLVAVSVMSTAWFHGLLVRKVTALLADATGARVEIGQMIVRPLTFHVIFHRLVLHGKEAPAGPPLFSARAIVVAINPATLVERRPLLRSLSGQGVAIHLFISPDGSTNLPGPAAARPGPAALDDFFDLSIHSLTLIETDFYWNDRRLPLDLAARNVALLLHLHPGPRYLGVVSASDLRLADSRWGLPPLTVSTRLELGRGQVNLTSLVWRSRVLSGSGTVQLDLREPLTTQFSLRAAGDGREIAGLAGLPQLRSGALDWNGEGSYRDGALTARGRFQARDLHLRIPSFEPGSLNLVADYTVEHRLIRIPRWRLECLGGSVTGKAEVDLAGRLPQFRLDARLEGLELAKALRSFPAGQSLLKPLPVTASLGGSFSASWVGRFQHFQSQFDTTVGPPAKAPAPGERVVTGLARGTAALERGRPLLHLEQAEFHLPHSAITAAGVIDPSALNANVQFQTSDFEEWRAVAESLAETSLPLQLESALTFSGAVSGTVNRPEVRGRLNAGPFEYRLWHWNHFAAGIDATLDHVALSSGELLGGGSAFTFDVSATLDHWKFAPDAPLELSAAARDTPIAGLEHALAVNYPLTGRVSGRLNVSGSRENLGGSGTLRIEPGSLAGEPFDWLTTRLRVSRSVWQIESLELAKGGGRLQGHALINMPQHSFSAELHGADFSLADFSHLQSLKRKSPTAAPGAGLEGELSVDVEAGGTFAESRLRAGLRVRDLRIGGSALGDFTAAVDGTRASLRVQGSLSGAAGTVHVEGTVAPQGDWPADLQADYANLRADPWIRSLESARFGAQVTITGSARLSGPLKRPAELSLESRNPEFQVSFPGLVWKNDEPVELALRHRVLTLQPFDLSGPSTQFHIQGSVRLAPPPTLDFTARGQIDATLLAALDPSLLAAGRFGVELRVAGTPHEPLLYGTVNVEDVSLGYPGFPFRLAGAQGQIRLDGDRLTIKSLRAVSGQSAIEASGFATLSGTPHYDLGIALDRSRIEYPLDFTSLLSGKLHLVGSTQAGVLEGHLALERMFVSEDFNLVTWLSALVNQPPGVAAPSTSLASRIRLDVGVATQPRVTVESPDLSLTADVNLSLRGTAADPVAFGSVHIERGQVKLRSNNYTIARGDVIMANPLRTQPVLDIEAQTRVQQYDLTLSITGAADRPRFAYRSSPPLSTPDILGLLALGHARQEEELSATGRSNFSTLGASALLSQALSSQASGRLQRLFGLSRIAIDPNPGGSGGARVTVQEQVARDFTVTYVNTTGGLQQRIIQVEWDLSDRVRLLGVRDQNGVFGVELNFRHHFK